MKKDTEERALEEQSEEAGYFNVPWSVKDFVPHLLDGSADFAVCPYNLMEVLSRDSCIGRDAADEIMKNVREFINIYRGLQ